MIHRLEISVSALGESSTHVAEVLCPGFFTSKVFCCDFIPGSTMDLRTGWECSCAAGPDEARDRFH